MKTLFVLCFSASIFLFGASNTFAQVTEGAILVSDTTTEFFNGTSWQSAVPHFVHPEWPLIEGATWIWKSTLVNDEEAENGIPPVTFRKKFTLSWPVKGTIKITADNAYELFLDGKLIGKDGVLDPTAWDFTWQTIETYNVEMGPGNHEFQFKVVNYGADFPFNTPVTNPASFIFKAELIRTSISVPYFNQTDSPWGPHEYDHATTFNLDCERFGGPTIAACGCALTSAAMLLKFYGVDKSPTGEPTNPDTLNNWLKINSGYKFGSILWPSIATYSLQSNEKFGNQKIKWIGFGGRNDFNKLNSELNNGRPVILEEPNHFVVATGISGTTYSINDPRWRDRVTLASYGNSFKSSRLYEPTSSDLSTIYITTPTPTQIFLVDSLGRRVGQDPNSGVIYNEIPNSFYFLEPILRDDTFEDSPSPNPNDGVTTLAIINPEPGLFQITTSGFGEDYDISFAGYDRDGNITTRDFHGQGQNYALSYSPELGSQINVTQLIDIDIKPGENPNTVNFKSKGEIPVAILTTPSFDATQVDVATVKFGLNQTKETHNKGHLEDVDNDGDLDLVLHFATQEVEILPEDTEICLKGKNLNGNQIRGCDSIRIIH